MIRAVGAQSHQSVIARARKSAQACGARSTSTSPSRAISNLSRRRLAERDEVDLAAGRAREANGQPGERLGAAFELYADVQVAPRTRLPARRRAKEDGEANGRDVREDAGEMLDRGHRRNRSTRRSAGRSTIPVAVGPGAWRARRGDADGSLLADARI